MAEIEPISDALPPGWKASEDQNGNRYYYNKDLNVTQWSRPEFSGGGGGVAVGRGGGEGGGGSSCLGGSGMVGGGIVGAGAVGLDTAAIQMQMTPMPQIFQHVHVPVERAVVVNSGNAMRGGVVGRVHHSAAAQAMLKALSVNTFKDRASELECASAVAELKPLLELAKDKNALKRALESLKEARRNAIKESIKAALTDSGGSAQLGDIQNLLITMHDGPSATVAMDLIAEAYKEMVEAEQYAEILKTIHVYKQKLKPMSYRNHEGLPNMRLFAGWLGWWPVCSQNAFWVCHRQEGSQETGDPDDFCPCYRPPPPPGGGGWCCPKEEAPAPPPPAKTKDIIGCTCMGTHCSCLMCHVIAEMVPFNWTEEKVYNIVEAGDTKVICRKPKEVPKALTMGAMSPG